MSSGILWEREVLVRFEYYSTLYPRLMRHSVDATL